MRKTFVVLSILALFSSLSASAAREDLRRAQCTYSIDPKTLQVEWTAFKTMQKVGVKGTFTEVTLESDLSKKGSFVRLLNQMDAEIVLDKVAKISTKDPGRDETLFKNFFSQFADGGKIEGKFRKAKGTRTSGTLNLMLEMNDKTLAVPMKYKRDSQGLTSITGAIDVLDFGLSAALDKIHQACEVLHRGTDGISKTWPQVEINIQAVISEKCK